MNTTLKFYLSESAILEALKSGQTLAKEQTVVLPSDLPAADTQVLATICGITNSTNTGNIISPQNKTITWDGETFMASAPHSTSPELGEAIVQWRNWLNKQASAHKEAKAKEQERQRERAEKQAAEAEANRRPLADFLGGKDAHFTQEVWLADKAAPESYKLTRAELLQMFASQEAEIEAEIAKRGERSRLAALALTEAENEAKNNLRQWGQQHGSALLKGRIEEKMNWLELAKKEWLTAHFPDFETIESVYSDNESAVKEWRIQNATLGQLEKLRSFRQQYPQATDTHLWRVRLDDGSHLSFICGTFDGPLGKPVEMCAEVEDNDE